MTRRPPSRPRVGAARRTQRGVSLAMTMVLLTAIALVAMVSFRATSSNGRVVVNQQSRSEALSAAQQVLEQTISSAAFIKDPIGVSAVPYPADIDGNGTAEYEVQLTPRPTCVRARPVKVPELDPAVAADLGCMRSTIPQSGADFGASGVAQAGNSLCMETTWDVSASVADPASGATTTLHQGVSTRVSISEAETCK